MEIKIKCNVTPNMLKEIQDFITVQETTDRDVANTSYSFEGKYGFYSIVVYANKYDLNTIVIDGVDTEHKTDSNILRLYMLENELTQTEFAKTLGITKQALEQFLNKKRNVPKSIIEKIQRG